MNAGDKIVKVMIGRFQPFHHGHLKCLRAAIDTANHVVVVIGSAQHQEPTLKNPWSYHERRAMIAGALTPAERMKVSIIPQSDVIGDDRSWVKEVKTNVRAEAEAHLGRGKYHFTLVGCHKGADTYYLKLYRGWSLDLMPVSEALNATDIRDAYFRNVGGTDDSGLISHWGVNLPGSSYAFLWLWLRSNHLEHLKLVIQRRKLLKENA